MTVQPINKKTVRPEGDSSRSLEHVVISQILYAESTDASSNKEVGKEVR